MRAGTTCLTSLIAGTWLLAATPALAAEPEPSDHAPPRYDEAPPLIEPGARHGEGGEVPLREAPFDGRGRLAVGGLAGAVSLSLFVTGTVLANSGDHDPLVYIPLIAIGATGLATSTALLTWGAFKLRRYRKWEAGQSDPIPPQGYGLVVPGAVLMAGSTVTAVVGGALWSTATTTFFEPPPSPPRGAQAMVGLGITGFVTGTVLFAVGARRTHRFGAWRRRTSPALPLALVPFFTPTLRGASLGVAGHF